ncbi:hypothetical protein [Rhizobium anhuiense]
MIDTLRWGQSSFASIRIIESEHALVSPKDAISDDMRCMVDDLQRLGQIHKQPGAYSLPDGTMIVHPHIYAALNKRLAGRIEAGNERMFMSALYGRSFI